MDNIKERLGTLYKQLGLHLGYKKKEQLVKLEAFIAQELEALASEVEAAQFSMNVDEYLPLVEAWDKGNFDEPFDHGFRKMKVDAATLIRNRANELK